MQSTAHTVAHATSYADTVTGYCLLFRGEDNKDEAGNFYTRDSNFGLGQMIGSPVVILHPELGNGPMEIGNISMAVADYVGIQVTASLRPVRLLSVALGLIMMEEFHWAIMNDDMDEIEIGEDGFVIQYPITGLALMLNPPVTGQ